MALPPPPPPQISVEGAEGVKRPVSIQVILPSINPQITAYDIYVSILIFKQTFSSVRAWNQSTAKAYTTTQPMERTS